MSRILLVSTKQKVECHTRNCHWQSFEGFSCPALCFRWDKTINGLYIAVVESVFTM